MTIYFRLTISFFLLIIFTTCGGSETTRENNTSSDPPGSEMIVNLLSDIRPTHDDGDVNAVIEIPAGTLEKWELNKSTGRAELELIDGKPRIIKYLGYPGNHRRL